MPTLTEKQRELDTKRGELAAEFKKVTNEDGSWKEITQEQQKEFVDRNAEINTLADAVKSLADMEQTARANEEAIKSAALPNRTFEFGSGDRRQDEQPSVKTLGQMFVESDQFLNHKKFGRSPFAVELGGGTVKSLRASRLGADALEQMSPAAVKTLMTTSAGLAPYPPRQADIVPFAVLTPVVADLIPQQNTEYASIIYLEITTWTRNAAGVAEGGQKPEDAIAGTNRTVPMAKIATTIPVSEEQLDDMDGTRDFVDGALRSSVLLEEDRQLLKGNGSSELTGFYNKSGINTGAKSTDDIFTAAHKMLTQVRTVGFATPSGYAMHTTDWEKYETAQDTTGRFILGDPGMITTKRLWGLPVVDTIEATQGTILTGDFKTWSKLYRRMDLRVDVGWVNAQFLTNAITFRAEMREALVIQRGSAFAIRTGF